MPIKKSNIRAINLTDKNVFLLQNMGYLNKKKKSTNRLNISEFVNRCIDNYLQIEKPEKNKELEARMIIENIKALQRKRDGIEEEMTAQSLQLEELRARILREDPIALEIEGEVSLEVLEVLR